MVITVNDFEIWPRYHPPKGFESRGRTEFHLLSRCKTWDTERIGRRKEMSLRNRITGEVFRVPGLLPDVVKFINSLKK